MRFTVPGRVPRARRAVVGVVRPGYRATVPVVAAPPAEIDWAALSMRSREIILHVAMRQSAGYSLDEVACALNLSQPELRHLEPPPKRRFTKSWVQARLRDVRQEIEASSAASG